MNNSEIIKLLIDVPVTMCRNMNQKFISTVLKETPYELSQHHISILSLLSENNNLIITDIVERLSIKKSQMTASADRLIELGFVKRESLANDRRKISLAITEEGKQVIVEINKEMQNQIAETLVDFSKEEITKMEEGLKVLQKLCITCKNKLDEK